MKTTSMQNEETINTCYEREYDFAVDFCFVKLKHAEFRLFKRSTDTSQYNFTLHYPVSHGGLKIPLHVYLVVPDLITKVVEVPLDLAHHRLISPRMR